jgi:hypothetical protein
MSHALLNAIQRTAAGLAIIAAVAVSSASPAQAENTIISSDCLHNFGYDYGFGYGRSYNGSYERGYFGGNANGYGGGSSSGYSNGGCVEIRRELTNPYVIQVPQPQGDREVADTAAHERQWRDRCHPVLRVDAYGVQRYHYAAPGCEYGRYE